MLIYRRMVRRACDALVTSGWQVYLADSSRFFTSAWRALIAACGYSGIRVDSRRAVTFRRCNDALALLSTEMRVRAANSLAALFFTSFCGAAAIAYHFYLGLSRFESNLFCRLLLTP